MRKIISVFMVLCMLCAAFAGCAKNADQTNAPVKEPDADPGISANAAPNPSAQTENEGKQPEQQSPGSGAQALSGGTVIDEVNYVMIYNPYIYDENNEAQTLNSMRYTGDIGWQIETGLFRADETEEPPAFPGTIPQKDLNKDFDDSVVNREGDRAGANDPVYDAGDTHSFFAYDSTMTMRVRKNFECVYEGTHCYIWSTDGSIGKDDAETLAYEFDNLIYENNAACFGTPRFTENGGKINILFYPLEQEGLLGFFTRYDIFSSAEAPSDVAEYYGINTDHAIITLNSKYIETDMPSMKATLAHEFQHMICASEAFYYYDSPFVRSWLDEAMSSYAEELNYPGTKYDRLYHLYMFFSDCCGKGQSLYHFNGDDPWIGSYGVVFLYETYLTEQAGADVFKNVHSYWRHSYSSSVDEADALLASVSPDFAARISDAYDYPASVSLGFGDAAEEWMSKLTLDFYIQSLRPELNKCGEYADRAYTAMLYSEMDPLYIEGGGRIIVSPENGSFTIPNDSGNGLVYVGLDSNFNVVSITYTEAD